MIARLGLPIAALLAGTAAATPIPGEEDSVARWTSPTLTRFQSQAEFRRYLDDMHIGYGPAPPVLPAPPPPVPPSPPSPNSERMRNLPVAVTEFTPEMLLQARLGHADQTSFQHPARPNMRESGVDEGGIVKRVGRFLLVLQDGRLFSIDTRPGGRAGLALADRLDFTPPSAGAAWYDQMLVQGDRVVISGYSESEAARQIVVLRLGAGGRLTREEDFRLWSDDYYAIENYTLRLAGDRLLIHIPYQFWSGRLIWPTLSRWRLGSRRPAPQPLIDARAIYRPVAYAPDPDLHIVAICRLGRPAPARAPGCATTGFIADRELDDSGLDDSLLHATATDAYIWVNADGHFAGSGSRCEQPNIVPTAAEVDPALVYRIALADGGLSVAAAHGQPVNEMSLAVIGGNFYALAVWEPESCWLISSEPAPLALTTITPARFGSRLTDALAIAYTALPGVGARTLENRFTDSMLVYGGRPDWRYDPPQPPLAEPLPVVVVPVARPAAARILMVPHDVVRIERAGSGVLLTGYSGREGLRLSLLDLDGPPRIASTTVLAGRFESEGLDDAVNSRIGPDGGLIGVPTALEDRRPDLPQWQAGDSDVSFLSVDAVGRLAPAGELLRRDTGGNRDACARSCLDLFRNAQPVFLDGRVFALIGSALVEGQYAEGRVRERRRLDIASAPARHR